MKEALNAKIFFTGSGKPRNQAKDVKQQLLHQCFIGHRCYNLSSGVRGLKWSLDVVNQNMNCITLW